MLPRRFQLDHQLRFTLIEGEAGTARLGETLRSVCSAPVWEVLHGGLRQALTTRQTFSYEAELPDEGRQEIEVVPEPSGVTVTIRPQASVVFSTGTAADFFQLSPFRVSVW